VSSDGFLSYAPNPNASGVDGVTFTVSYNGGPASDPATVNITVTPVNDAPVAGSTTIQAVQNVTMSMNLIANATDPDGVSDVKTAVITSWPVELGPQPVPVNGSITIAPSLIGNYTFGYKVVDAAGVQSENDGVGTVTVIAGETITINRAQIETDKIRWRVDGTDTIRSSQTISITFANGTLSRGPNAGQTCDGTDRIPECTIGTTGVTATGTWALDSKFGSTSFQNPATAGGWSVVPTRIRAWSSNPVLGGGAEATISRKN
ncbi:MAG TPA: Ig-like domain-containing protein, partial [Ramlibacter sp.]|uniref:Ig-like domain-containing protein n=1 Tax=Ramlibacter sp. TaxID=1917967 RepID=UPI002D7F1E0D